MVARGRTVRGRQPTQGDPSTAPTRWPEVAVDVCVGSESLSPKDDAALLAGDDVDAPFPEVEELRSLLSDARGRGFVSFDEVTATLEEVEVTKEQVQELHGYLVENGIDVVGADGKPTALVAGPKVEDTETTSSGRRKPEIDLTVEPSLD